MSGTIAVKAELLELLEEKEKRVKFNTLKYFTPYPWQKRFAEMSKNIHQKLALCANRVGKSIEGAREDAIHLTGRYPEDWPEDAVRFASPVRMLVAGVSSATTRDVMQKELFGEPGDPEAFGTGMIPKEDIINTVRFPGIPNAYASATIRHKPSGGVSYLYFAAYEQGHEKLMGKSFDWAHLDEEAPQNFYTQTVTRTADADGYVMLTMTPEAGLTQVVNSFINDIQPGQAMVQATWDDAPHIDEETKKQLLGIYSPSEAAMRSKGIPMYGSGLCYPIAEEEITIDPFELPEEWPRLAGIDLGWTCPTCVVWVAWDRQNDRIYVYDEYGQEKEAPIYHTSTILSKPYGHIIPCIFPHDGNAHEKGGGDPLAEQYAELGVNRVPGTFTNPPTPDQKMGGLNVDVGISEILQRLQTGRIKIFSTCFQILKEMKQYHRKEEKIQKGGEDHLDAMRYAVLSVERFGVPVDSSGGGGYYRYQAKPIPNDTQVAYV